ncbi:hypothetical protein J2Z77_003143 [Streptomyces avidinii]|uniref:Uncharacterized protein n=1 Tax=Streptomyces avidinii TaxID=1895 RepID=A0ABS4L5F7_STRAV|nr:hypothetical protein [Streptomyces avidinii]
MLDVVDREHHGRGFGELPHRSTEFALQFIALGITAKLLTYSFALLTGKIRAQCAKTPSEFLVKGSSVDDVPEQAQRNFRLLGDGSRLQDHRSGRLRKVRQGCQNFTFAAACGCFQQDCCRPSGRTHRIVRGYQLFRFFSSSEQHHG